MELAQSDVLFAFGIPLSMAVCGLVFIWLSKIMIILASVGVGTILIMQATGWPGEGLAAIGLFAGGLALQLMLSRKWRDEDDDDDD
jgi:hypothetical protein